MAAPAQALAGALRAELERRAAAEAGLRGMLADARAELHARSATQSRLEAAHDDLRAAIEELRRLVEREASRRGELESTAIGLTTRVAELEAELTAVRAELAVTVVARDAAGTEAAGLRAELDRLGADLAGARAQAQGRAGAIAEAQAMLAEAQAMSFRLRAVSQPLPALEPGSLADELAALESRLENQAPQPGPVQAERLQAALVRLREAAPEAAADGPRVSTPPPLEQRARSARPWLVRVFKQLLSEDPVRAGQLLLALAQMQHAVHRDPVAYDLILGPRACVRVTAREQAPEPHTAASDTKATQVVGDEPRRRSEVDITDSPRPLSEVDFQVVGELASIARTVLAGRLRRRFGRRTARVDGDLAAFAALRELVQAPFGVGELHAAGVRLAAPLALCVVSIMIDPADTAGERFAIAHQAPGSSSRGYLQVCDGKRLAVSDTLGDAAPTATIVCAGDCLLPALAGVAIQSVDVQGELRALELVQGWLARAQWR